MGKLDKIKELIEERFERYQTYYQLLGIQPNGITDEIVKEAYDKKCKELSLMLKDLQKQGLEDEGNEIREIIQTALDDAYRALKDENSRQHYQDVLDSIEGVER